MEDRKGSLFVPQGPRGHRRSISAHTGRRFSGEQRSPRQSPRSSVDGVTQTDEHYEPLQHEIIQHDLLTREHMTKAQYEKQNDLLKQEIEGYKFRYIGRLKNYEKIVDEYEEFKRQKDQMGDKKISEYEPVDLENKALRMSSEFQHMQLDSIWAWNEDLKSWNEFYRAQNQRLFEQMMAADEERRKLYDEIARQQKWMYELQRRNSVITSDADIAPLSSELPINQEGTQNIAVSDRGPFREPEFPAPKLTVQYLWPLHKESRRQQDLFELLLTRAYVATIVEDWVLVQELMYKASHIAHDLGYQPLKALCFYWLGTAYFNLGEMGEALDAYEESKPAIGKYIVGQEVENLKEAVEEATHYVELMREEGSITAGATATWKQPFGWFQGTVPEVVEPQGSESEPNSEPHGPSPQWVRAAEGTETSQPSQATNKTETFNSDMAWDPMSDDETLAASDDEMMSKLANSPPTSPPGSPPESASQQPPTSPFRRRSPPIGSPPMDSSVFHSLQWSESDRTTPPPVLGYSDQTMAPAALDFSDMSTYTGRGFHRKVRSDESRLSGGTSSGTATPRFGSLSGISNPSPGFLTPTSTRTPPMSPRTPFPPNFAPDAEEAQDEQDIERERARERSRSPSPFPRAPSPPLSSSALADELTDVASESERDSEPDSPDIPLDSTTFNRKPSSETPSLTTQILPFHVTESQEDKELQHRRSRSRIRSWSAAVQQPSLRRRSRDGVLPDTTSGSEEDTPRVGRDMKRTSTSTLRRQQSDVARLPRLSKSGSTTPSRPSSQTSRMSLSDKLENMVSDSEKEDTWRRSARRLKRSSTTSLGQKRNRMGSH